MDNEVSGFSLAETLSAMGMPQPFTPGQADLSGMNGDRKLFAQAVVHKAVVQVNESTSSSFFPVSSCAGRAIRMIWER
jgi:serine protease inhibitor